MSTISGTHNGRLTDEHRARQQAKHARSRSRRTGVSVPNGTTAHKPCAAYEECTHRKHGYTPGKAAKRSKNNRSQVWPLPFGGGR